MADQPVPLTPEWWLARLWKQLNGRRREIEKRDDYYRGEHPLPWLAPQARADFRRILKMTRSNYMSLVCEATCELARVEGFRLGAGQNHDSRLSDIWEASNMDADSDMGFLESTIGGTVYLGVAPNKARPDRPTLTIEHALNTITEYAPGAPRRAAVAGLRVWDDDWTGEIHAVLQLVRDGDLYLFKYKAARPKGGRRQWRPDWQPRAVAGELWPAKMTGVDEVLLFELPNNPRLRYGGISEIGDSLTDIQDRVNKTIADRLMTQDYGAFPQKWAKAWPDEDANGNPTPPIDIGRDRMVTTSVAEAEFGQWSSAPLDPYSAAKREDVKDIAALSRTPADYLLGELNNVNGETLRASRAGQITKVKQRMRYWEEGIARAMRASARLSGSPLPDDARLEVHWSDPEYRTEGERTDAVIKRLQSGVIDIRQAREDCGYTLSQIEAIEEREAGAAENDPIVKAARGLTVTDPTQQAAAVSAEAQRLEAANGRTAAVPPGR